ncbi:MAG: methyltransferase type 11 [uncultured bacterium]|nr:MAG: methyltransferase type 11 [uncultured bacterium]
MTKKDFDRILNSVPPDYYQKGIKGNILQKIWHGTKIKFALKLLNNISFKNCLEVGSASGHLISEIAKKHPKVKFHAIDAYKEAIEFGKKKYPHIKFLKAEAEKLPFKNNQFDLILCYETIEHVRNPKKVISEMRRVLKKKGKLILAMDSGTLTFRIIWFFWERTRGRVWQAAHLNPYHHRDLEALVLQSGFKITQKYFTHFGLEIVLMLEK